MKMKSSIFVAAIGFIATLSLTRGDDFGLATGQDSPLVQTSSDSHIKVTMICAGPIKGANGTCGILFMYEDLRTDEQRKADGLDGSDHSSRGRYSITDVEFRVGHHKAKGTGWEERPYVVYPSGDFISQFGNVQIPKAADPDHTMLVVVFSDDEAKDPYELHMAIGMPDRGKVTFHFRDLTAASFTSH